MRVIGLVSLLVVVAACGDRVPSAPGSAPVLTGRLLSCEADVRAGTVSCAAPGSGSTVSSGSAISADVILGGQGTYVQLSSTNVGYDATTEIFHADVTVQNLTGLTLGTPDGSTVSGVKVFFNSGPSVATGTGTVAVANADGVGTFMGTHQPYFLYGEILPEGQVSAPRTWQWSVSSTVGTFVFTVLVDAAAPVESFFRLDVSVIGGASRSGGHVLSSPGRISCTAGNAGSCTELLPSGLSVTLNAVADDDATFAGWGGDCAGGAQSVTVVMTSNRSCVATFNPLLRVAVSGSGTVTSSPPGVNCSTGNAGVCQQAFPVGTVVTLTSSAASGWTFSTWTGDCTGGTSCIVTMSAVHSVAATFVEPVSLVIGPKPLVIGVGGRPNLDVVVTDNLGNTIPNPTVTFVSRNPFVASLSPGGVLNGLARGQSVVVATASGGSSPSDSLLALVAAPGGPVVMTDITQFDYAVNTTVTATLIVDMRNSGELLGSTTVNVTWNQFLLSFQSVADGGSGVSPIVNVSHAGNGLLTVSMADPSGFAGRVELVRITFTAAAFTGTSALSLTPTELTGAGTFTDLLPQTVAASYPFAIVPGGGAAHAARR